MACYSSSHVFTNSLSSTETIFSRRRKAVFEKPLLVSSSKRSGISNSPFLQAARLLGPATRFEASKLKVVFLGEEMEKHPKIIPRTYTLTHCDLTANLTLAVSDTINIDQLSGWYNRLQRDDVVAEWKKAKDEMSLHVHCHVSGAHLLLDLAAEFRYHIFTKELPLVLKALIHGDSVLFSDRPELMDARVWVYFHSNLMKYNRMECWGPLKDAAKVDVEDMVVGFNRMVSRVRAKRLLKHWRARDRSFEPLLPFSFDRVPLRGSKPTEGNHTCNFQSQDGICCSGCEGLEGSGTVLPRWSSFDDIPWILDGATKMVFI